MSGVDQWRIERAYDLTYPGKTKEELQFGSEWERIVKEIGVVAGEYLRLERASDSLNEGIWDRTRLAERLAKEFLHEYHSTVDAINEKFNKLELNLSAQLRRSSSVDNKTMCVTIDIVDPKSACEVGHVFMYAKVYATYKYSIPIDQDSTIARFLRRQDKRNAIKSKVSRMSLSKYRELMNLHQEAYKIRDANGKKLFEKAIASGDIIMGAK